MENKQLRDISITPPDMIASPFSQGFQIEERRAIQAGGKFSNMEPIPQKLIETSMELSKERNHNQSELLEKSQNTTTAGPSI